MENYKDGIYSALAFHNRLGGAAEMTEENIRNNIEKALKEQERRDGITRVLNAFSMAIMTAYNSIMKVLGPLLTDMAKELSKQDLGTKIRAFGTQVGEEFQEMWPKLKKFLTALIAFFIALTILYIMYIKRRIAATTNIAFIANIAMPKAALPNPFAKLPIVLGKFLKLFIRELPICPIS